MQAMEEVKKIEQQAQQLEQSYKDKIQDMEKQTAEQITKMKNDIQQDIAAYQEVQERQKQEQLDRLREESAARLSERIARLNQGYAEKKDSLVKVVIEEVMRKYGNS